MVNYWPKLAKMAPQTPEIDEGVVFALVPGGWSTQVGGKTKNEPTEGYFISAQLVEATFDYP